MSYNTSSVPRLRTVKAVRGTKLKIDLGQVLSGDMKAWMKKDPNDSSHREFNIEGNRYLVLPIERTMDYIDGDGNVVEEVKGKWYFDVRLTPAEGGDEKIVYQGTIVFRNNITGSTSIEILSVKVESFTAAQGQTIYDVSNGSILDNGLWTVQVDSEFWNSTTGVTSFSGGNLSIDFQTGRITFVEPLYSGQQVIIKYN